MSMIFDRFPSRREADGFAASVTRLTGLGASVYDDEAAAMEHDLFPLRLVPPIVHVDRDDDPEVEKRIVRLVRRYNGTYAGT
jgi:hypothetical protein